MKLPHKKGGNQKVTRTEQKAPAQGILKANVDRSFASETGDGAIACMCCDCHGNLVGGFARSVQVSSATQAEAMAVVQTLIYLEERGNREVQIESDNLDLVEVITGSSGSRKKGSRHTYHRSPGPFASLI